MSLHFEQSLVAKQRLLRQRIVAGVASLVSSGMLLAGAGSLLDLVRLRKAPQYQPQFVMQALEVKTTCGGCSGIPVKWPIHRKPTAPTSAVRPLGLAPHALSKALIPAQGWDLVVPDAEFGDEAYFGCRW